MARLNVADWIGCTEVEGPGKRFALWVQGCLLRCPGCCNPRMLDISPALIVEARDVYIMIEAARKRHRIEGVTFLGGEPMLQAKGLSEVAHACRDEQLSVTVFTGYTLEHLRQSSMPGVADLLSHCDLLVDGAYVESRPETVRNWCGSANQRFHYLSDRYGSSIETDLAYARGLELRLSPDGGLRSSGWPARQFVERLIETLPACEETHQTE